jgi:2-polyprenyl-3-methyl-5-hydroxy-6-metoxy-1,4-benzoquinol methylase
MKQTFSAEDDLRFIEFLAPYFRDPRYIRVNDRPMLLVYRVSKLPDPPATVNRWRSWCRDNGIGDIHLVAVCHGEVYPHVCLEEIGFDAYAAFPPHSFPCQHIPEDKGLFEGGYRLDYASGVDMFQPSHEGTRLYEGCTLGWDNTARFGRRNVTMYLNFSLEKYYQWLRRVMDYTRTAFPPEERLMFINAWNEWAEGAYLEPDRRYGYACLNTTARALYGLPFADCDAAPEGDPDADPDSAARYTRDYEWLKYLIESNGEYSLAVVNRFIEDGREILEFGSAAGYFTRFLKQERGATVDIVELDSRCAGQAAAYARRCCVGDIEQYDWQGAFSGEQYDYILFADVLEHLRDPWHVLKASAGMLKPGGRIVVSVPNIAHAQILASLYNNDFSYADVGIMDRTHLRFFTADTLRQMIEESGLAVSDLVPVRAPVLPRGCGTRWNKTKVPAKLRKLLAAKEHAHAIQFVACCRKAE